MDSEPRKENVALLESMGFPSIPDIISALRKANNDISQAVAILTDEKPVSGADSWELQTVAPLEQSTPVKKSDSAAMSGNQGFDQMQGCSPRPSATATNDVGTEYNNNNNEVSMSSRQDENTSGECVKAASVSGGPLEFPFHSLYQLEDVTYRSDWQIPFKHDESFAICLESAIQFAEAGKCQQDNHCVRFNNNLLPDIIDKLMTAQASREWDLQTVHGVFNMLKLSIQLIATRLKDEPFPISFIHPLLTLLDPRATFYSRVRNFNSDITWSSQLGGPENLYATSSSPNSSPSSTYGASYREQNGGLVEIINLFGFHNGFVYVCNILTQPDIDYEMWSMLLGPFERCAEYLNVPACVKYFEPIVKQLWSISTALSTSDDLLKKNYRELSHLFTALTSFKIISLRFWPHEVEGIDDLYLKLLHRMISTQHYNSKMTSLVEISKNIQDSMCPRPSPAAIDLVQLKSWLSHYDILSLALEGSIDQAQYTSRIQCIVDAIGADLTNEQILKIWNLQEGKSVTVTDNIYTILVSVAVRCGIEQLNYLSNLILTCWQAPTTSDETRHKLITVCSRIGTESRHHNGTYFQEQQASKILETVWRLTGEGATTKTNSTTTTNGKGAAAVTRSGSSGKDSLSEQAYQMKQQQQPQSTAIHTNKELIQVVFSAHLSIITDVVSLRERVAFKKQYITKSVDNIKMNTLVLPTLRYLSDIVKTLKDSHLYNKSEKAFLTEMGKSNNDIVKYVSQSLAQCHAKAVLAAAAGADGAASDSTSILFSSTTAAAAATPSVSSTSATTPAADASSKLEYNTLVDGIYSHEQYVRAHLDFLGLYLQAAPGAYLTFQRVRDIWDTLVTNKDACNWDKEMCFDWFRERLRDLEADAQSTLFHKEILKLNPRTLSEKGFECFEQYFENQNRLNQTFFSKITSSDKELVGQNFIWEVCLNSDNERLVSNAISYLVSVNYSFHSPEAKRDPERLHSKFIDQCYGRLCETKVKMGSSPLSIAFTSVTSLAIAAILPFVADRLPPVSNGLLMLNIERLLRIAEHYITVVESGQQSAGCKRTVPCHRASFFGLPMTLEVSVETSPYKKNFQIVVHSNETLSSVRSKIASSLRISNINNIQLTYASEKLNCDADNRLLCQLGVDESRPMTVTVLHSSGGTKGTLRLGGGSGSGSISDSPVKHVRLLSFFIDSF